MEVNCQSFMPIVIMQEGFKQARQALSNENGFNFSLTKHPPKPSTYLPCVCQDLLS